MSNTLSVPMQSIVSRLSQNKKVWSVFFILLGVLALAVSAQIIIPLKPVPITLQSLTVMLIPMLYGWRQGTLTVALYVLAGACGLPIFAGAQFGLAVLFSPLGGYLVGFIVAAFVVGWMLEKGFARNTLSVLAVAFVGNFFIYSFGLVVLTHYFGFAKAIATGFMPFIFVMPIKMAMLALVVPLFWKRKG